MELLQESKAIFYHPLDDADEYLKAKTWTKSSGSLADGKVGKALSREDIAADLSGDTGDYDSSGGATKVAFCGWFQKPSTAPPLTAAPTVDSPIGEGATSVSGTGVDGAAVEVFVNGGSAGNADAPVAGGTWAKTGMVPCGDGDVCTARQRSAGELQSIESNEVTVQAYSAAPTVDSPVLALNASCSGTGVNGSTVEVFVNGGSVGNADGVVSGGTWSKTGMTIVGEDAVKARQTESGKLQSGDSNEVTVTGIGSSDISVGSMFTMSGDSQNYSYLRFLVGWRADDGSLKVRQCTVDSGGGNFAFYRDPITVAAAGSDISVTAIFTAEHIYNPGTNSYQYDQYLIGWRDSGGSLKIQQCRTDSSDDLSMHNNVLTVAASGTNLSVASMFTHTASVSYTYIRYLVGWRDSDGSLKLRQCSVGSVGTLSFFMNTLTVAAAGTDISVTASMMADAAFPAGSTGHYSYQTYLIGWRDSGGSLKVQQCNVQSDNNIAMSNNVLTIAASGTCISVGCMFAEAGDSVHWSYRRYLVGWRDSDGSLKVQQCKVDSGFTLTVDAAPLTVAAAGTAISVTGKYAASNAGNLLNTTSYVPHQWWLVGWRDSGGLKAQPCRVSASYVLSLSGAALAVA